MSSFRSRIFQFALRNRNIMKFQLERRPEITRETSIPGLRAKTEKASGMFGKIPKGFTIEQSEITDFYAEFLSPERPEPGKVILYFHGGGYVLGSAKGHRVHVSKVVAGTNIKALVFDYALAPEHPFPEGLNDALSAYNYLLMKGYRGEDISFMGDSAGGGLALVTVLALKEKGTELPACVVALSPWTDLKNTGDSLKSNEEVDYLTWRESWTIFSECYCSTDDVENPLVSPLYGELEGFPPVMIIAGTDELLRDDSVRFVEKAHKAGVEAELILGEGMFHCYPVCSPIFPEATEAMEKLSGFIKSKLLQ